MNCCGSILSIEASNALAIDPKSPWRLDRQLSGGGALLQVGIDVLRTQRLWADSAPVWVIAQETKTDATRFAQIDESVTWSLGFASGTVAHGAVSLNYPAPGHLKVQGPQASFCSDFPSANHYWSRADQLESFAASIQGMSLLPADRFNSLDAANALEDMLLAEAILRSIKQRSEVQLG
jgi:predicted dehydrogenase